MCVEGGRGANDVYARRCTRVFVCVYVCQPMRLSMWLCNVSIGEETHLQEAELVACLFPFFQVLHVVCRARELAAAKFVHRLPAAIESHSHTDTGVQGC